MQPEDVTDLVIAMGMVVLLFLAAWALQSSAGSNEAEINSNYNFSFEESIFLVNYLRTPVYEEKFTIADYVLMCDNEKRFKELKKKTSEILRGYNREVNIVILCNGKETIIEGSATSSFSELMLKEGYGVRAKIYSLGALGLSRQISYKPFGG